MEFTDIAQAIAAMEEHQKTLAAYNHAIGVLYLDATTAAPKDTWEGRGKTMEVLSEAVYRQSTSQDLADILAFLQPREDCLDTLHKAQLKRLARDYEKFCRVPKTEYIAYQVLINDAQAVWEKAKNANDFPSFAPYLEKIVDYNRRFAGYYSPGLATYDALLKEYEEGLNMKILDAFFSELRSVIVPLLAKTREKPQIDDGFLHKHYPVADQRDFSDYLMEVMGLDRSHCGIAETEHPYTTNFNNKDVRITTHYHEDDLVSSMYSVIHEGGHALYELGCDDVYNYTCLYGGVSMGVHESQSRFYENIIGRSRAFIHSIYPYLQKKFSGQLDGITEEQFYRAVNKTEPGLIRTEADELTYCLHVAVRYEIEKKLIDGSLKTADVPAEWNRLYREYLGVDVPDDTRGCLQDSHWSGGSIGYFPSYALGSAYGAQMLCVMQQDLGDVYADVAQGNLGRITAWLREHIHQFASFKTPGETFTDVCGQFDAKYYTDYLTKKYTELYEL